MHHPTDRIAHTAAFVTPVLELERETAQWVHPVKDRSDDPSINLGVLQLVHWNGRFLEGIIANM